MGRGDEKATVRWVGCMPMFVRARRGLKTVKNDRYHRNDNFLALIILFLCLPPDEPLRLTTFPPRPPFLPFPVVPARSRLLPNGPSGPTGWQPVRNRYSLSILDECPLSDGGSCRYLHLLPRPFRILHDTRQGLFIIINGRLFIPERMTRNLIIDNLSKCDFKCHGQVHTRQPGYKYIPSLVPRLPGYSMLHIPIKKSVLYIGHTFGRVSVRQRASFQACFLQAIYDEADIQKMFVHAPQ